MVMMTRGHLFARTTGTASLFRKFLQNWPRVIQVKLASTIPETPCHGPSHDAKPDESDFHAISFAPRVLPETSAIKLDHVASVVARCRNCTLP
jgi:hypothetical protein